MFGGIREGEDIVSAVNSFGAKDTLRVGDKAYEVFRLDTVPGYEKLPFSLKVLLENLLRTEDGANVTKEQIEALGSWVPTAEPDTEIQFTPARVVMQDFTGVPCIVDLATMREAVEALGGDPNKINPLAPAEMVIDHSVIADLFGTENALERNVEIEYERNGERYQFLRWGQTAFDDFKVVPPGTGIVHQVNIETSPGSPSPGGRGVLRAYPDTCVGTDSHTTMVNGLGVLGWGVGGIEAEAAMLGQPVSMLIPKVVGFKLSGSIPTGVTATDVVLTITDMLRKHGVVGKFVEFYGSGVAAVPLANRATIGNMSPEFGSTAAMFPIDDVTLDYLRLTGRSDEQVALVEAYSKVQKLWHDADSEPVFSEYMELDLGTVVPSIAGPKRPQDRIELTDSKTQFEKDLLNYARSTTTSSTSRSPSPSRHPTRPATRPKTRQPPRAPPPQPRARDGLEAHAGQPRRRREVHARPRRGRDRGDHLVHQHLEPVGDARRRPARPQRGEEGPQGQAVGQDHAGARLEGRHRLLREGRSHDDLEALGFYTVGYGCTTCIGNSGPLIDEISAAVNENDLAVTAVLSGNRNFEGRINPDVKMNYLASPPLVIAYALAGSMNFDFEIDALGRTPRATTCSSRTSGPMPPRCSTRSTTRSTRGCSRTSTRASSTATSAGEAGDPDRRDLRVGRRVDVRAQAPVLRRHDARDHPGQRHRGCPGAREARRLGHDRPHQPGRIHQGRQPGRAVPRRARRRPQGLQLLRLAPRQPRGDDPRHVREHPSEEPAARQRRGRLHARLHAGGCSAGVHLRREPELPGRGHPAGDLRRQGVRLRFVRDWAAKGTSLLGVRAVIAESFERIHRRTSSAWASSRCSSRPARTATRSASTAQRSCRSRGSRS